MHQKRIILGSCCVSRCAALPSVFTPCIYHADLLSRSFPIDDSWWELADKPGVVIIAHKAGTYQGRYTKYKFMVRGIRDKVYTIKLR